MKKILVIEDEQIVLQELMKLLESYDYFVTGFSSFSSISWEQFDYDLVLLDINLPGIDGFEIAKKIRTHYHTPIIFLTSRNTHEDEVKSILVGGDDYIIKPYEPKVLLLKMNRILNRTNPYLYQTLVYCGIELVVPKSELRYQDKVVILSRNELQILYYLFLHQKEIVSKDDLIEYLWDDKCYIDENALNVNITRIRKKLEEIGIEQFIKTIPKEGYQI